MSSVSYQSRASRLFVIFAAFFVANALIAECIGVKVFSLEKLFGAEPLSFSLLGEPGLAFSLTCGVLLWPLEFVMTDIVNEYYGPKAVRRISFIAVALIAYAFLMFFIAMKVPAADFWYSTGMEKGVPDMSLAFNAVFGQGMWIIVGSLVAFLVAQIVDVHVFHRIKRATGEKKIWLRATGSTVVSQLVDSFIVLYIAFHVGNNWSIQKVLAIGMVNYAYKFIMAILLTPLLYLIHHWADQYLGKETAAAMKKAAMSAE
ncbi:MAG TPA: queuosine precursor transporter [Ferruginibacter sp.]|jgi:uncharacterized integral membrane protein (TIGR00697 family)|nr:hypothetical protein [Chitinophagaceae bacterium]HML58881.1 queuosine precursor transporter [Ferruginibacter sp.]HRN91118.1 queuosine precursor transporter [Ferruginibacter sp.]HRO05811.1 queuosine precursor transporter [Ferruginibacter sp.]HRO95894.1 queuosine precursor transporter [Ferruginibacter sp.]